MPYSDHSKEHWDSVVTEAEKKQHRKDEAKALYASGMLHDGELFSVIGAKEKVGAKEIDAWVLATFIGGKMAYIHYPTTDRRLARLKSKAASALTDQAKAKMINTRQAKHLPSRYQSPTNTNLVLFGSKSSDKFEKVLGDSKDAEMVIKSQDQIVEEVKNVESKTIKIDVQ